ncbi:MAG TPA: GspH/FimT family pseudopilin [Gammaproteobacteria bacterium]|nr:GspH/FimT family pseudopilin [Gammaproteobacteria bacterium]
MRTRMRIHGFTTIELIAVVIIVGILAAFTVPHFLGRAAFDARGVHDSLASALRYAQKVAIASNCPIQVQIRTGGYSVKQQPSPCSKTGSFTLPVTDPAGNTPLQLTDLHGVTLTPATVTFSPSGAAGSADTTIAVSGAASIPVIGATGYVDAR